MKKILEVIFGLVIGAYILGTFIATPYYTWDDIQKNDSFIRYIFVSPIVGFFKSSVWPYYVFIDNDENKSNDLTEIQNTNVKSFITAQEYLNSAMILSRSLRDSKNPKEDLEKVKSLLEASRGSMQKCDRDVLNSIVAGWGDISLDVFVKAVEYSISALTRDGDKSDLARGDALMFDYKKWLQNNWAQINNKLNGKES